MNLTCMRAEFTLQQRVAGISSAAGLFLEEHLASCAKCRATANLLSGLGALHASDARVLSAAERERVIAAALSGAAARSSRAPALSGLRSVRWLALPALAALAGLAALAVRSSGRQAAAEHAAPDSVAKRSAAANVDRVLSGQVELAGAERAAGALLANGAELHTAHGALLALAHARVELRAGTRAGWDASRHELQLTAGSVFVDVNEQPHERFMVKTTDFAVLVLGTRFEVTLDTVRVARGRVRVLSASGAELAVLDASTRTSWRWTPAPQASTPPTAARSLPSKHAPSAQPAGLLERARSQLVARQVPAARRTLEQVLALPVTPDQRAEALSLRADCALVAGEFPAAIDAYLRVFKSFGNLPAGETALFAAARLEAEHGSSNQAAHWLSRYLARYPEGRFAKEARARLHGLATTGPSP
jgi:hypothetical protein